MPRVKLTKMGHGTHSSTLVVICVVLLLFVLFYILFVCKCVLYHCHQVTTQLQLTNISYPFISYMWGFRKTMKYINLSIILSSYKYTILALFTSNTVVNSYCYSVLCGQVARVGYTNTTQKPTESHNLYTAPVHTNRGKILYFVPWELS
jgi:hypothetical protein